MGKIFISSATAQEGGGMKRLDKNSLHEDVVQAVNDIMETLGIIPPIGVECKPGCRCVKCYERETDAPYRPL